MKRRELIYTIAGTTLAAGAVGKVLAGEHESGQEVTPEGMAEFLFVQYAESVKLADGKLTLTNVARDTLYFSDRPERIVGREATTKWVEFWSEGENSFAAVPPNAVLAIANPKGGVPLDMVLVLKSPAYADDTMVYTVDILDAQNDFYDDQAALNEACRTGYEDGRKDYY